jgi:hypothetical protein
MQSDNGSTVDIALYRKVDGEPQSCPFCRRGSAVPTLHLGEIDSAQITQTRPDVGQVEPERRFLYSRFSYRLKLASSAIRLDLRALDSWKGFDEPDVRNATVGVARLWNARAWNELL